jgi:hypothetical protein
MGYRADWNATDQIPERALRSGLIAPLWNDRCQRWRKGGPSEPGRGVPAVERAFVASRDWIRAAQQLESVFEHRASSAKNGAVRAVWNPPRPTRNATGDLAEPMPPESRPSVQTTSGLPCRVRRLAEASRRPTCTEQSWFSTLSAMKVSDCARIRPGRRPAHDALDRADA